MKNPESAKKGQMFVGRTYNRGGSRISRGGGGGGGGRGPVTEGCEPPAWALFGENECENEKIGSCRGACAGNFCL